MPSAAARWRFARPARPGGRDIGAIKGGFISCWGCGWALGAVIARRARPRARQSSSVGARASHLPSCALPCSRRGVRRPLSAAYHSAPGPQQQNSPPPSRHARPRAPGRRGPHDHDVLHDAPVHRQRGELAALLAGLERVLCGCARARAAGPTRGAGRAAAAGAAHAWRRAVRSATAGRRRERRRRGAALTGATRPRPLLFFLFFPHHTFAAGRRAPRRPAPAGWRFRSPATNCTPWRRRRARARRFGRGRRGRLLLPAGARLTGGADSRPGAARRAPPGALRRRRPPGAVGRPARRRRGRRARARGRSAAGSKLGPPRAAAATRRSAPRGPAHCTRPSCLAAAARAAARPMGRWVGRWAAAPLHTEAAAGARAAR